MNIKNLPQTLYLCDGDGHILDQREYKSSKDFDFIKNKAVARVYNGLEADIFILGPRADCIWRWRKPE